VRENEAFSDSYHTKAHDQISELKNSRLGPERRFVDLSEEGDPPFCDPSSDQSARRRLPVQSLDGLRSEPLAYSGEVHEDLGHGPELTVQRRGGWHHAPLGVLVLFVGLLTNNQFAHL